MLRSDGKGEVVRAEIGSLLRGAPAFDSFLIPESRCLGR